MNRILESQIIALAIIGCLLGCLGCSKPTPKNPPNETGSDFDAIVEPDEDLTLYDGIELTHPESFAGVFENPEHEIGLAVGQLAPEIAGNDLAGNDFKLSDYRGNVVLIFFWGDWCESADESFRKIRQLAKKHLDAPFAVVGVNNDDELAQAQLAAREKRLFWRSFFDGQFGPLAQRYRIQFFPSYLVLDKQGIIRHKTDQASSLAEVVTRLLGE